VPDGLPDLLLIPGSDNTVIVPDDGVSNYDTFYGLTLINHSGRDPFLYLIYFDTSEYSIQEKSQCLFGVNVKFHAHSVN